MSRRPVTSHSLYKKMPCQAKWGPQAGVEIQRGWLVGIEASCHGRVSRI